MAARNPQTMAKRAREQAVKERRDRKRAKKAEAAAERAAKSAAPSDELASDGTGAATSLGDGELQPEGGEDRAEGALDSGADSSPAP
jgi:hypothetical protein